MIEIPRVVFPADGGADTVPELFAECGIRYHKLECCNWAKTFPYVPDVRVGLAHTSGSLLIHYRVEEETSRAVSGEDFGSVWEDSCVEFFCSPDPSDGIYYNIECSCIGKVLLCAGRDRHNREKAPSAVMEGVKRYASLGYEPFAERSAGSWDVALIVPCTSFFKHRLTALDGAVMRANIYKCGDMLRTPHYISIAPIGAESPDFHRPEFFTEVKFL